MGIIKRYILDGSENYEDMIVIEKFPNGKFFIIFGYMEDRGFGTGFAGGYTTIDEAEKMLKLFRRTAKEI